MQILFQQKLGKFFYWTGVNHLLGWHVSLLCSSIFHHCLLFCDVCVFDVNTMGIILDIFQFRNAHLISTWSTISAHDCIFLFNQNS